MSYGWAILIVIVVGGAMWQLGVFNRGGSAPPTTSGFETIKPFIPTVRVTDKLYSNAGPGQWDGFSGHFTNGASSEIAITGVDVRINGMNQCSRLHVYYLPGGGSLDEIISMTVPFSDLFYQDDGMGNYFFNNCLVYRPPPPPFGTWSGCNPPRSIRIPPGGSLIVTAETPLMDAGGYPVCYKIISGERYEVAVELTYDIELGGATTTKHESGKIYLTA